VCLSVIMGEWSVEDLPLGPSVFSLRFEYILGSTPLYSKAGFRHKMASGFVKEIPPLPHCRIMGCLAPLPANDEYCGYCSRRHRDLAIAQVRHLCC